MNIQLGELLGLIQRHVTMIPSLIVLMIVDREPL